MKRRDLERHLKKHGARLLREGGRHGYWGMDAERSTSVPRHREIHYPLARAICKQFGNSAAGWFSVGMSAISVFVSRPTAVNPEQESFCDALVDVLADEGLQARTLGVTDYPGLAPLAEVLALMRECNGALALGLRQLHVKTGEAKAGTSAAAMVTDLYLSTPWKQIEAGMAVALGRPLLVAREKGVEGGVFDIGSSDRFIHQVDFDTEWLESPRFRQPFEAWVADVHEFA